MATPLTTLRKYQFAFLVVFGVVCMLVFVIGDPLDTWLRSRSSGSRHTDNQIVVSWNGGRLRENEIGSTQTVRNIIREFIRRLLEETQKKNAAPKVQPLRFSSSEEDIVYTQILAQRAADRGMKVSDETALAYLDELTANLIPRIGIGKIFEETVGGKITEQQLLSEIKSELLARNYIAVTYPDLTGSQLPYEAWEYHQRLNRRIKAEVLPVPVVNFKSKVTKQPTETEIDALYAMGKDRYRDPASPDPGFKRFRKAAFQYVKAGRKKFEEEETAKLKPTVTDAEIQDYYGKNKEKYRVSEEPPAAPQTPAKPDSDPAPATTDKTSPENKSPENKSPAKDSAEKEKASATPPANQGEGKSEAKSDDKTAPKSTEAKDDPKAKSDTAPEKTEPSEKKAAEKSTDKPEEKSSVKADDPAPEKKANSDGDCTVPQVEQDKDKAEDKSADEKSATDKDGTKKDEVKKEDSKKEDTKKDAAEPPVEKSETPKSDAGKKEDSKAAAPPASADTPKTDGQPAATPSAPAAPTTPPAAATKPEPKYKPLDEKLKEEIREELAKQKAARAAQERIDKGFSEVRRAVERYAREKRSAELNNKPVPPPLDLAKLTEPHHMAAASVPLSDPDKVQETELGKTQGFDSSSMSFEPIPFHVLAYQDGIPLFKPDQIRGGMADENADAEFLYWKTQEVEPFVPELKDIRDEVVDVWKVREAVVLAEAEAKALADKARQSNKPLKETFSDKPDLKIAETNPFTWMTRGFLPVNMGGSPTISTVDQVEHAGMDFMRSVFKLKTGEVGTAVNQPRSVVYVVRVQSESPSEEILREQFLQTGNSNELQQIAFFDKMDLRRTWIESIRKELNVKWERPPQS